MLTLTLGLMLQDSEYHDPALPGVVMAVLTSFGATFGADLYIQALDRREAMSRDLLAAERHREVIVSLGTPAATPVQARPRWTWLTVAAGLAAGCFVGLRARRRR